MNGEDAQKLGREESCGYSTLRAERYGRLSEHTAFCRHHEQCVFPKTSTQVNTTTTIHSRLCVGDDGEARLRALRAKRVQGRGAWGRWGSIVIGKGVLLLRCELTLTSLHVASST